MPQDLPIDENGAPRPSIAFLDRIARRYAARAAFVWLALHLLVVLVTSGKLVVLPAGGWLVLLILGAALGIVDTRQRNEILTLGNLGVSEWMAWGIWPITLVLLEGILRTGVAILARL